MVIGLGYKARVGKTTTAEYLNKHYGYSVGAFADTLKDAARVIFGLSQEQLYGDQKEVEDLYWRDTPRNIIQKLGTECMRWGYREDVWVLALGRKVLSQPGNWAIADVRFPNEIDAIRSWGGKVVLVNRPDAPSILTAGHVSETALDRYAGWDYVLDNSSSLENFYTEIEKMMRQFTLQQPRPIGAIQQETKP